MPYGDDIECFGEDEEEGASGPPKGVAAAAAGADKDEWHVDSQEPWEFRGERCTLTSLETADQEHCRFEVLRRSGDVITVTCTRQQFQELCDEQAAQTGPARIQAAIRQLFAEGLEEFPESTLVSTPKAECGDEDRSLDGFGEEDFDDSAPQIAREKSQALRLAEVGAEGWCVESQQAWSFGGELCTLICLASGDGEELKFEVVKPNCDTITITCSRLEFQERCSKQTHGTEPARADAAMRQLFREGLEQVSVPPSRSASKSNRDVNSRLKAVLKSWNRCSNGSVPTEDMRALLHRLHPSCPDDVLRQLLASSAAGGGGGNRVSVDALVDSLAEGAL